jgi:hypothetical protein
MINLPFPLTLLLIFILHADNTFAVLSLISATQSILIYGLVHFMSGVAYIKKTGKQWLIIHKF